MERDSFLAHGISYVLHDRLLNCSDKSEGLICLSCGSILSTYNKISANHLLPSEEILRNPGTDKNLVKREVYCRTCQDSKCAKVVMPFVLRYLANELTAMNIKMTFKAK
jgi:DNA-directed RNA polymerase, beta subunit/140 kD subunit